MQNLTHNCNDFNKTVTDHINNSEKLEMTRKTNMSRTILVVEDEAPRDLPYPTLHGNAEIRLEGDQIAAAKTLVADVEKGGYGTTLLKGVTGSGKTSPTLARV